MLQRTAMPSTSGPLRNPVSRAWLPAAPRDRGAAARALQARPCCARAPELPVNLHFCNSHTRNWIRTSTELILSQLPLPVGLYEREGQDHLLAVPSITQGETAKILET